MFELRLSEKMLLALLRSSLHQEKADTAFSPTCHRMIGYGLLILMVTLALLVYDGMTVLVLYVSFILFMLIYYFSVRKRVKQYGEQDLQARRAHSRVVQDTFRGYAELEVNGAFPVLQASFLEGLEQISRNRVKLDTILRLPFVPC